MAITKITVSEAHDIYGISKARLYDLLSRGKIAGYVAKKRGRNGGSWIDEQSLKYFLSNRVNGRPAIKSEGNYVSVTEAAKRSGYSPQRIHQLINEGIACTKSAQDGKGRLVLYPGLFDEKS